MHGLLHSARVILSVSLLLSAVAPAIRAQVRELPVAFDSAGRVMVVTQTMADSSGLRSPSWPITGPYVEARLFKQSEGGYIIAVRRADETVDRYSISLEQFAAIRASLAARAAPTVVAPPPVVVRPAPVGVQPPAAPVRPAFEQGGRLLANGQVLLATALYGPAIGAAARAAINDPLAYFGAWFGLIGGSLYVANRVASDPTISLAQGIEANHAGLHGAGIGAALTYLMLNDSSGDRNDGAYGTGIFLGGVGGAYTGYRVGQRMTTAEAVASSMGADVGLLLGIASVASRSRFEEGWDRSAAATLVGSTIAGYLAGPLYPRMSPETITAGDVLSLTATGVTGILVAGVVVDQTVEDAPRAANILALGMLGGLAAGHPLLVQRADHSIGEAGVLVVASIAGAYGGSSLAQLGADESASPTRVLVLAALGSAATIWVVERRYQMRGPSSRAKSRVGDLPRRTLPRLRLDPTAGALAAARTPGNHALVRIAF